MTSPITMGTLPDRLDLTVFAGDPIDQLIAVRDAAGVVLDVTTWTCVATAKDKIGGNVLYTFTLTPGATGVQLTATEAQTSAWATWSVDTARLSITAKHPSGEPIFRAVGWLTVHQ